MSVNIYQTTQLSIPQDSHRRENLKSFRKAPQSPYTIQYMGGGAIEHNQQSELVCMSTIGLST
jgi:hypothetical protein